MIIRVDHECDCDTCWEKAIDILWHNGIGHNPATDEFNLPAKVVHQLRKTVGNCPHNPPTFAPSIFLWD